ncbi:MAG: hypothetical protein HYU64_03135 [Armatimonadetes bacterium]|nr:hypothetical protein [Armatimonadota bacterium]
MKDKMLWILVLLLFGWMQEASWGSPPESSLAGGSVTLPWNDFQKILSESRKGKGMEPPPREFVLSKSVYHARLRGNGLRVSARYNVRLLKKGWIEVPLLSTGIPLTEVIANGEEAAVYEKDGTHHVLVKGPGTLDVRASFLLSGTGAASNRFTFPLPRSSVSTLFLDIPQRNLKVDISPSVILEEREEGGKTGITASLSPAEQVTIAWVAQGSAPSIARKKTPKLYSDVSTLVSVGEGVMRCTSFVDFSIIQAGVSELLMTLPENVEVQEVTGGQLQDWHVIDKSHLKTLLVRLAGTVEGQASLVVKYEKSYKEASAVATVPELVTQGVQRERGFIGVSARTNVEVNQQQVSGATPVDVRELPSRLLSAERYPILKGYKYIKHPVTIALDIKRHEDLPVLTACIDEANLISLITDEGQQITKALYRVRNNLKQFVKFKLPPNSEILSAFVSDQPVKPAKDQEGHVLIPLERSQGQDQGLSSFPLEIVYLSRLGKLGPFGSKKSMAPEADIPVTQLYWTLFLPDELYIMGFGGNLKTMGPLPQQRLPGGPVSGLESEKKKDEAGYGGLRDEDKVRSQAPNAPPPPPQVAKEREFIEDLQSSKTKGVLPVRIEIPQKGREQRFTKLLLMGGNHFFTTNYVSTRFYKLLQFLLFLLALIGGYRVISRRIAVPTSAIAMTVIALILLAVTLPRTLGAIVWGSILAFILAFVLPRLPLGKRSGPLRNERGFS